MAAQASAPASSLGQSETPTRTPAPYGQACVNCAKAKCKCIFVSHTGSGSGFGRSARPVCERCARLGRECKPPSSARKRGAAGSRRAVGSSAAAGASRAMSAASRAANLEQKLEDLVAILKAQAPPPSNAGEAVRSEIRTARPSVTGRRSNDTASGVGSGGGPTVVTPASTACTNSTPSPLPAPTHDVLASAAEAEETLVFFRDNYLQFFPFVHLPTDMTAAQLQRDRPFLWLNITAICCRSPIKQAAMSQQIREELAQKILVTCERNMDMLLGALCLLGWTMHLCFKPTMSAVMSMATSIVTDLRLDKPTQDQDPRILNCFKSNYFATITISTVRTMEERRATLACYVFCSSGSAFVKCQSMTWTPHMEDSLRVLAADPECDGDLILVLMVRIRRLIDDTIQAQTTLSSERDKYGTLKPPVSIYIKYFRQCLQTIKDELPESLKDNRLAVSTIMSAEMIISEIPFSNYTCWSYLPDSHVDVRIRQPRTQPHTRQIDIDHMEASFATLQTSKAFFEHFLTFDLPDFAGFSFPVLLNLFRAAQILYRLRVVDELEAEQSAVLKTSDLLAAIERIANRFDQLPGLYGFLTEVDDEGNEVLNFYDKCSKTFSATLSMWRAHFAQAEASRLGTSAAAGAGTSAGTDASGGETGSQVPPAMMSAGLNPNLGCRVNYPGMNNFMLPELFPIDFSMDDTWYNEILPSWDPSVLGPIQ